MNEEKKKKDEEDDEGCDIGDELGIEEEIKSHELPRAPKGAVSEGHMKKASREMGNG